jgi:hypothetical protein
MCDDDEEEEEDVMNDDSFPSRRGPEVIPFFNHKESRHQECGQD